MTTQAQIPNSHPVSRDVREIRPVYLPIKIKRDQKLYFLDVDVSRDSEPVLGEPRGISIDEAVIEWKKDDSDVRFLGTNKNKTKMAVAGTIKSSDSFMQPREVSLRQWSWQNSKKVENSETDSVKRFSCTYTVKLTNLLEVSDSKEDTIEAMEIVLRHDIEKIDTLDFRGRGNLFFEDLTKPSEDERTLSTHFSRGLHPRDGISASVRERDGQIMLEIKPDPQVFFNRHKVSDIVRNLYPPEDSASHLGQLPLSPETTKLLKKLLIGTKVKYLYRTGPPIRGGVPFLLTSEQAEQESTPHTVMGIGDPSSTQKFEINGTQSTVQAYFDDVLLNPYQVLNDPNLPAANTHASRAKCYIPLELLLVMENQYIKQDLSKVAPLRKKNDKFDLIELMKDWCTRDSGSTKRLLRTYTAKLLANAEIMKHFTVDEWNDESLDVIDSEFRSNDVKSSFLDKNEDRLPIFHKAPSAIQIIYTGIEHDYPNASCVQEDAELERRLNAFKKQLATEFFTLCPNPIVSLDEMMNMIHISPAPSTSNLKAKSWNDLKHRVDFRGEPIIVVEKANSDQVYDISKLFRFIDKETNRPSMLISGDSICLQDLSEGDKKIKQSKGMVRNLVTTLCYMVGSSKDRSLSFGTSLSAPYSRVMVCGATVYHPSDAPGAKATKKAFRKTQAEQAKSHDANNTGEAQADGMKGHEHGGSRLRPTDGSSSHQLAAHHHQPAKPVFAALVTNTASNPLSYSGTIRLQPKFDHPDGSNGKRYPRTVISDLKMMFKERLEAYRVGSSSAFPHHILFFRSELNEHNLITVRKEMNAIKKACQEMQVKAQLTYICVNPSKEKKFEGRVELEDGLSFDPTMEAHGSIHDFCLQSMAETKGARGTCRRYTVFEDQNELSKTRLQLACYDLCQANPFPGSTKTPLPLYFANRLSRRGKLLLSSFFKEEEEQIPSASSSVTDSSTTTTKLSNTSENSSDPPSPTKNFFHTLQNTELRRQTEAVCKHTIWPQDRYWNRLHEKKRCSPLVLAEGVDEARDAGSFVFEFPRESWNVPFFM